MVSGWWFIIVSGWVCLVAEVGGCQWRWSTVNCCMHTYHRNYLAFGRCGGALRVSSTPAAGRRVVTVICTWYTYDIYTHASSRGLLRVLLRYFDFASNRDINIRVPIEPHLYCLHTVPSCLPKFEIGAV